MEIKRLINYCDMQIKRYEDNIETLRLSANPTYNWDKHNIFMDKMQKYKGIKQALEKQLNGGWIPTLERLPGESGYYLIQQDCSLSMDGYMRVARFDKSRNKFRTAEVKCYYEDVIAWQPLPELYKEVQQ